MKPPTPSTSPDEHAADLVGPAVSTGLPHKSVFKLFWYRILQIIARVAPGCSSIRPALHRLRGVKIYGNVYIHEDVYLENNFPECIELHDNVRIGLRSTLMTHYDNAGRLIIEKDVWIGPCCTITATGETRIIGEGSVLSAGSVVNRDVPPRTLVSGVPAKPVARITVPLEMNMKAFKCGLRPLR